MFSVPQGAEISCGWLIVPEDRDDPQSPTIQLAVAIIYSSNPNPEPDPVIYLNGGPGGSSLPEADAWAESALLTNRDLILIDQRGTGYSQPSLNCPEVEESENGSEECYNRLVDEGVNLSAYNSRENAADIADLIVALGIQEANLYGISYGTRLALTVMRDRPEQIRSVVIDGVYPPNVQGYNEQPLWADRAFQELFNDCEDDAACDAAFPNLRQVFYDTVDELNNNPAVYADEASGEDVQYLGDDFVNELFQLMYDTDSIGGLPLKIYQVSEGIFGEDVVTSGGEDAGLSDEQYYTLLMQYLEYDDIDEMYDYLDTLSDDELSELEDEFYTWLDEGGAEGGADTAEMSDEEYDALLMQYLEYDDIDEMYDYLDTLSDDEIAELEEEFYASLDEGGAEGEFIDDDSEGMFAAVECNEEVHFNNFADAEALSQNIAPEIRDALLVGVEQQFVDCEIWQVERSDDIENEPVFSDIPTLVLSGQYDPITPPEWGAVAAETLSNSYYYIFPAMGHGSIDVRECPTNIVLEFFDNPTSEPDASCMAEMPPPVFVTDNG